MTITNGDPTKTRESRKSSILKVVTYRVIVTAILAAVTWLYTGSLIDTSFITIVYSVLATVAHYILERTWKGFWK
jgi:uncharacterized membrane protein